ncbi:MAG: adhesin [Anaerovoracaceae bacterium]|jgi:hypothetical protein
MVNSKKRIANGIIAVILVVAVAVVFSACGSESSSDSSDSNTAAAGLEYVSPSEISQTESSSSSSSASSSTQSGQGSGSSGGQGGASGGGANTSTYDYTGTNSATKTADGETVSVSGTVSSTTADKNAVLALNSGTLKIEDATLKKSGDDTNGDNCNFYGLNSTLLAVGEKTKAYISDTSITSTSEGSNGIFATDNARVYANDVDITTKSGGNARGVDATYGGVVYGNELDISTQKDHCAALATDRGGGYISVTNSKLKTAGSGSPLLYSTGDIEVDGVSGTATGSQIAGMEGLNRIIIYNSKLTSTNDAKSGSDPIKNGVILYQSTSGDAEASTSSAADFEAVNSTLKTSISDGAMFYVTNTNAKVVLKNTKLSFDSDNVDLIDCVGNSNNWGQSGSNGGTLTFTGRDMTMSGNVKTDDISSVDMYLLDGTKYTGKTTGSGNVTMNVSSDSKWVVTGNCTVENLNCEDGGKIVDKDGNTVTIKANGKTVVKGDSDYTITVTGEYSTTVKETSSTKTATKVLSRSAFDKYYDTSTKFGTNELDD